MKAARSLSVGLAALVVGCGGAGISPEGFAPPGASSSGFSSVKPKAQGRLAVRVAWPQASRVVPTAAQSLRIEVRQGSTSVASTLLVSPATTATLTEVPVGSFTLRATAYANVGGTGVAIASAESPTTVTDGATTSVPLTLASTVNTLQVTPSSVTILLSILSWRTLTPVAKDANGNVVPIAAADWEFSSDRPLIAQVSSTGTVTGLIPGSATVTVKEKTSGKTFDVPVAVVL